MRKLFSTRLFGYCRGEVDRHIEFLTRDYEEELCKKKDRIIELSEENRRLKQEIQEQKDIIDRFAEKERYISRALIEAEQQAQAIVEEGQKRYRAECDRILAERERWKNKLREVRSELLAFDQTILRIIEKFRDEINYYAAKEISESILMNEEDDCIEEALRKINEAEAAVAEEMPVRAQFTEGMHDIGDAAELVKIDDKIRKVIA